MNCFEYQERPTKPDELLQGASSLAIQFTPGIFFLLNEGLGVLDQVVTCSNQWRRKETIDLCRLQYELTISHPFILTK